MEDRRIFARFQAKFPLKYLDLQANKEGEAQVQDLCAKGLCLLTKEALNTNTPLEMWLQIPDKGEPLYTRGEVVWSRPEGANECRAGVCFEKANLMGLSRVLRTI
jgi:Tfp pilus assembly protein PilZ